MLELDNKNQLTDLAFLVDLTTHLNVHLQGENQLIGTLFQTITVIQMKLNLWQAKIKPNNFMHLVSLAKHSPMHSKKIGRL